MSVSVQIPKEYGYVIAVTSATFFVSFWHGMRAGLLRKSAKISPPKAFADSADMNAADAATKKLQYIFNCAQRAHSNYLESQPSVALSLLISGLQYPMLSAGLGTFWLVGRIVYAVGYTNKTKENGSGRGPGFLMALPFQFGLWGLTAWSGIKLLL